MQLRKVNAVPEREKATNKYREILDEFLAMDANGVELLLDGDDTVGVAASRLRSITYNTPAYRHIKVKVRWNEIYLVKEGYHG